MNNTGSEQPRALTRVAARSYLATVWGLQLSASYLAGASDAGPRYSVIGRKAYYLVSDLDNWARVSLGLDAEPD